MGRRFESCRAHHPATINPSVLSDADRKVRCVLAARHIAADSPNLGWVFPSDESETGHINHSTLRKPHDKALRLSKVPEFVLYSLRHSFATRIAPLGSLFDHAIRTPRARDPAVCKWLQLWRPITSESPTEQKTPLFDNQLFRCCFQCESYLDRG